MSKNRFYTNKEGLIVEVTHEHLQTAVTLKIELQKMSPSLRCNWKKHKEMMEEEGFEDSDINEGYRILVKDYQRQIGLLTPLSKHVDMVEDNKLDSLKSLLGELYSEKRDNQLALTEINKFKRDFHLSKVVAEEIVKEFKNFKIELPHNFVKNISYTTYKNSAVVALTDLHIGEIIKNVYGNYYNYEIAKMRMRLYTQKVVEHCVAFNIGKIFVAGLGDFVEHLYMRAKQSRHAEFGLAQQILKASELIVEFLITLSNSVNVEYCGIAGNHDRLQGDKDINFDEDNANVIINYNIKTAIQFIDKPNKLKFIDIEDGASEMNIETNGRKIKLVHGHLDNGNKKDKMKGYISMQNDFFDCLVYGHLHHYHVEDSDHGRLVVGVGCMSGRNDYGKHFSAATNASQMMLIIREDGELIPLKVDLQIV